MTATMASSDPLLKDKYARLKSIQRPLKRKLPKKYLNDWRRANRIRDSF